MPRVFLDFNGITFVRLRLDIHGHTFEEEVAIDTGFATGTGFGLKVPYHYIAYARYYSTGTVTLADGGDVPADYVVDMLILAINGQPAHIVVPAIFMDGPRVLGCMILQACKLELDGPRHRGQLDF